MNVAYVHTAHWPSNSPGASFTTQNAAALAGAFDECWFFVKSDSEAPPASVFEHVFAATKPGNLHVRSLTPRFSFSNRFFYRQVVKEVRDLHREKPLDAVICRNVTFLPYLVRLRHDLGIPVLFESHDFYADLSVRDDIERSRWLRQQRLERRYLPRVSALICLQEGQKRLYRDVFPDLEIVVARTGIESFHGRPGPGSSVTYVGSLDSHKGVEFLIRAVQASTTKPPLLIIGGKHADRKERVERVARESAPDVSVTVLGWLDRAALRERLNDTAVGVVPLRDTFFNRHLTSPLKLFDYYGHGIPVVAADLPALRELVDDGVTGLLYTPESESALAESLDTLWSDEALRARMSESISRECRSLLWSERAGQLADVVRTLRGI